MAAQSPDPSIHSDAGFNEDTGIRRSTRARKPTFIPNVVQFDDDDISLDPEAALEGNKESPSEDAVPVSYLPLFCLKM